MKTKKASPKNAIKDASRHLSLMDKWPKSWAGVKEDIPVGEGLIDILKPFIVHLHEKGLSPKTIRRHLDNLWVIGGEIIRELGYDSKLRKKNPSQLLFDAIETGEAPLARHATETEQNSLDATAKKLHKFLSQAH